MGCRNYPASSVCAFCCQELLRSSMVVHIGHYTKLLPFGHYRCYVECYRLVTTSVNGLTHSDATLCNHYVPDLVETVTCLTGPEDLATH